MNITHLHLMTTHIPIVGLAFAFLMNLYAFYSKNSEVKKLTFWFYLFVGISALPAILSGDGASEFVQGSLKISEDITENHENWAYMFFSGIMSIAGLSMLALYFSKTKENLFQKIFVLVFVLALITLALGAFTGFTGGAIRHIELG